MVLNVDHPQGALGHIDPKTGRIELYSAERFGSATIRLTVWQNCLISDIAEAHVLALKKLDENAKRPARPGSRL